MQEKKDNSKQTGAAGGKQAIISEVDTKILEIVGTESAAVIGLDVSYMLDITKHKLNLSMNANSITY